MVNIIPHFAKFRVYISILTPYLLSCNYRYKKIMSYFYLKLYSLKHKKEKELFNLMDEVIDENQVALDELSK